MNMTIDYSSVALPRLLTMTVTVTYEQKTHRDLGIDGWMDGWTDGWRNGDESLTIEY